jgi:hypothetical protein
MTSTTMTAKLLRVGILGVAVGLLPSAGLAGDARRPTNSETFEAVPDHAQAEAQGAGRIAASAATVPDHAQAEARNPGDATTPSDTSNTMGPIVPDHATAESRGGSNEE